MGWSKKKDAIDRAVRSVLQLLEGRRMLSVSIDGEGEVGDLGGGEIPAIEFELIDPAIDPETGWVWDELWEGQEDWTVYEDSGEVILEEGWEVFFGEDGQEVVYEELIFITEGEEPGGEILVDPAIEDVPQGVDGEYELPLEEVPLEEVDVTPVDGGEIKPDDILTTTDGEGVICGGFMRPVDDETTSTDGDMDVCIYYMMGGELPGGEMTDGEMTDGEVTPGEEIPYGGEDGEVLMNEFIPIKLRNAMTVNERGVLKITGTDSDDSILVSRKAGGGMLNVRINGERTSLPLSGIRGVRIDSGDGNDRVRASNAHGDLGLNLVVRAGAGKDVVLGGDGDDRLLGGKGADRLRGAGGDDILRGNAGRDRIDAGAGDDLVDGGTGFDMMIAGEGSDAETDGFDSYVDADMLNDILGKIAPPWWMDVLDPSEWPDDIPSDTPGGDDGDAPMNMCLEGAEDCNDIIVTDDIG
jgi:RTX calcium-binding nonapeptide repeat (4 copies)